MIWFNFLISYLILVFLCGIGYTTYCSYSRGMWDMLLYAPLTEFLDVRNSPKWVRYLAYIVFTIMFLPYLIVYYTFLVIYAVIIAIAIETNRKKNSK